MDQQKWESFLDGLAEAAKEQGKSEVSKLLNDAKTDSLDYVKQQGQMLEKYLTQLAQDEITSAEFKSYVEDMKTLALMEIQRQGVAGQASIQRFIAGLTQAVMQGLFRLL